MRNYLLQGLGIHPSANLDLYVLLRNEAATAQGPINDSEMIIKMYTKTSKQETKKRGDSCEVKEQQL